jgi:diphosphomevalonate decarboxylase
MREGSCQWTAPSNIALVKYWGKFGDQLPSNPSISLTLSAAHTKTAVDWKYDPGQSETNIDFLFEGERNQQFTQRVRKVLVKYSNNIPELKNFSFTFSSENSFPHSAGIASSASGMAALSLCIVSALKEFCTEFDDESFFYQTASSMARQASGSACRSFYGPVTSWGKAKGLESSNIFAAPVSGVNDLFSSYHDSILILSSAQKSVSSSAGHALMESHPYRNIRFSHATQNCEELLAVMKNGDLVRFCEIVEQEALELHGLMMTSRPSFILMKAETLQVIEKVRSFREKSSIPLCFTLDAGPNVHLLYPDENKIEVQRFIEQELILYSENRHVLHDEVGHGPRKL